MKTMLATSTVLVIIAVTIMQPVPMHAAGVERVSGTPRQTESTALERTGYYTTVTLTAYCSCYECCGDHALNRPGGIVKGAMNVPLKQGYSLAGPWRFGTKVRIGNDIYEVQDRTHERIVKRYNGKILDVYFEDHAAAWAFGKRTETVFIFY